MQKQKTREVKGKEYFRWSVVIPPNEVEGLGWKEGTELAARKQGERLVVEKKLKNPKSDV